MGDVITFSKQEPKNTNGEIVKIEKDLTEWCGKDWETFVDFLCADIAETMSQNGVEYTKWDVFAEIMQSIIRLAGEPNG